jgi:hypothetical protein
MLSLDFHQNQFGSPGGMFAAHLQGFLPEAMLPVSPVTTTLIVIGWNGFFTPLLKSLEQPLYGSE